MAQKKTTIKIIKSSAQSQKPQSSQLQHSTNFYNIQQSQQYENQDNDSEIMKLRKKILDKFKQKNKQTQTRFQTLNQNYKKKIENVAQDIYEKYLSIQKKYLIISISFEKDKCINCKLGYPNKNFDKTEKTDIIKILKQKFGQEVSAFLKIIESKFKNIKKTYDKFINGINQISDHDFLKALQQFEAIYEETEKKIKDIKIFKAVNQPQELQYFLRNQTWKQIKFS